MKNAGFTSHGFTNRGFTLVELTIYIALFSFISVLFFGVASHAQFKFTRTSCEQEHLLRQALALDLLRRDLMSASFSISDWDARNAVFKKTTLSVKNIPESACVSWFIGAQGLTRARGEYDFVKHEWINRTSCLVCKSISQISFVLQKVEAEKREACKGVWVVYKNVDSVEEKKIFVKFRNRVEFRDGVVA